MEEDEEQHIIEAEEFQVEFDSSDEEGRKAETLRNKIPFARKKLINSGFTGESKVDDDPSEALSGMHVSKNNDNVENTNVGVGENDPADWSSGDENESMPTGYQRQQLYEEFISMMEERFLDGKDIEFFDYTKVDIGEQIYDKIHDQDMEDKYFDSEEPD